ncbi:terminus macrodomain insulation protein YfbV [Arsukibacterium sp.]|uniref:terminus macrodomain insulation protein YfbV n=1 Tax=Arsukibacterium sp. TaxID=1977258 RepID=UPI00299EF490|nr:terminus macrodomain insulation protein YfbV [Arsukibacterium sp.]MDX1676866.1 terminus macrodomain insulation protein YfbV [Arsukibacterium sp.]
MKLFALLREGRQYSQIWPVKPELNPVFPENKIIQLTNLAIRYLPGLAVLTAFIQLTLLGSAFTGQILAMMLFILSMPLQGLYWLGVRSSSRLPPSLVSWCRQLRQQMREHGVETTTVTEPRLYSDLAHTLAIAYKQLDKTFMRPWL